MGYEEQARQQQDTSWEAEQKRRQDEAFSSDQSARVINHYHYGSDFAKPETGHTFYDRVSKRGPRFGEKESAEDVIQRVFGMGVGDLRQRMYDLEGMGELAELAMLENQALRNTRIPEAPRNMEETGARVYNITPEELARMKQKSSHY